MDLNTTDDGVGSILRGVIVIPVSPENLTEEETRQIVAAVLDAIIEGLENAHDNPEHSDRINAVLAKAAAVVSRPVSLGES
jgi:ABC-type nitrate/sulfonate/bicarbonate transport system substrate-binding protein